MNRLLDIQQLGKVDDLHGKVNEIAEYGKVTVEALERLESRYERARSSTPEHKKLDTPRSLDSIASQLSRIESLLSVGPGSASSSVAPKSSKLPRLRRTGSTSSWHSTHSTSAIMASESRKNSFSSWPIKTSTNIFQRSWSAFGRPSTKQESVEAEEASRLVFHSPQTSELC